MSRLILTHEQADFDAVASLLAAWLIDPSATPVLPRRINRNVRAFLTIYAANLPFTQLDELERGNVERITLVDTQTLPSIKGAGADTRVHVVDHHEEEKLPPDWSSKVEPLGATTTILVETLQQEDQQISSSQATLLLLGIYEDTGSLLYPGTRARDIQACVWLMRQGASLEIASEYLNLPLSEDQLRLYESLLANAESVEVQDLDIIIACADLQGSGDEISTLAHKLRDIFDAAGLFVLVKLNGGIQLVARSTTDQVNVAAIAGEFGGGGHGRAAAALIKSDDMEAVKRSLVELLEQTVQPSMRVSEIMSRGAQVLQSDEQVRRAAEQMQRSGHEGYPVVSQGKVVGLLTRRAVDRAMSHGMGKHAVSEVMESGDLVVHPDHSIRHLQQQMIERNWGQVPVAHPETGEILGIVTRTDLLKALAVSNAREHMPDLVERLEAYLPPARLALARLISAVAEKSGLALYLVGGFVRDLWLGIPSQDYDFVVEGDAIALAQELVGAYGGRLSTHPRFGTAKWQIERLNQALGSELGEHNLDELPAAIDFVTARTEFYTHPSALPSVTEGSIKLDLHRRDFSINTLAMRLDGQFYGQLLDHWGGGRDLEEKRIRVLHSLSFVDDPTRMLRAVRLEQRLGFQIEPRTMELLENAKPLLGRVSGERLRSEIELVLKEPKLDAIMGRLNDLGLLEAIQPSLTWDEWLGKRMQAARESTSPQDWQLEDRISQLTVQYALWMARLNAQARQVICDRLHLPMGMVNTIEAATSVPCELGAQIAPSQLVRCLQALDETALVALWHIHQGEQGARDALDAYVRTLRHTRPHTDGEALKKLGLPPGPIYADILWRLRQAWLDGEIQDREAEGQLLQSLLSDVPPDD